jgi:hypothetical protein
MTVFLFYYLFIRPGSEQQDDPATPHAREQIIISSSGPGFDYQLSYKKNFVHPKKKKMKTVQAFDR